MCISVTIPILPHSSAAESPVKYGKISKFTILWRSCIVELSAPPCPGSAYRIDRLGIENPGKMGSLAKDELPIWSSAPALEDQTNRSSSHVAAFSAAERSAVERSVLLDCDRERVN
jgi:hypothetical protein